MMTQWKWDALIGAGCFLIGYLTRRLIGVKKLHSAEQRAKDLLEQASQEAASLRQRAETEARELSLKIRQDFEEETKLRRQELETLEKRSRQREENIDRKVDFLDQKEKELTEKERILVAQQETVTKRQQELETLMAEERSRLSRIGNLSLDQARKQLLDRIQGDLMQETNLLVQRMEERLKQEADTKAKKIVGLAIQRCAAEYTIESTTTVMNLPSDEMKGRIIGREGRNVRTLESLTGVDIVIDDTPQTVVLSSFDMVRREIARLSLERLMSDGRIHPARIEEVVERVKQEFDQKLQKEGEDAVLEIGLQNVHPEIIKLLGKLRFRTSYGQNILVHQKEVAHIMGVMAAELGEDFHLARRIGLLHDIGKAVTPEVEGTHALIGAGLARKYGESELVVNAIESHHEEVESKSLLAILVQAADAISAARPGARGETLEAYARRLQKLEDIAYSFKGVEQAFAIQAGREIRIVVHPEEINDLEAIALARDIRKRIEGEVEFPGEIKVTVIRETRAVEYAK